MLVFVLFRQCLGLDYQTLDIIKSGCFKSFIILDFSSQHCANMYITHLGKAYIKSGHHDGWAE